MIYFAIPDLTMESLNLIESDKEYIIILVFFIFELFIILSILSVFPINKYFNK